MNRNYSVTQKTDMVHVKYNNDKARCPKCQGMLCYDASMTQKLPIGFGFASDGNKFQMDCIIRKGWRGQCMNCEEVVFAVKSERHVTTFPKSINKKLKLAA